MQVACVYVAKASLSNLEIGLAVSTWGWRDKAISEGRTIGAAQALQSDDLLLMGSGGPDPRVPPGGWSQAVLGQILVARVTRPFYEANTPLWPNDVFPNRLGIAYEERLVSVDRQRLSVAILEAFRYSAVKYGGPVMVETSQVLELTDALRQDSSEAASDLGGQLDDLDRLALVMARREQTRLRAKKFGGVLASKCDLCGREFPVPLLRLAHVKRRSECSSTERTDQSNLMAACTFGCDEMFERGLLRVSDEGIIETFPPAASTEQLLIELKSRKGATCLAWTAGSAPYFRVHASRF